MWSTGRGRSECGCKASNTGQRNEGQSIKWSLKIQSDTSSEVISVGGQDGLGRLKAKDRVLKSYIKLVGNKFCR